MKVLITANVNEIFLKTVTVWQIQSRFIGSLRLWSRRGYSELEFSEWLSRKRLSHVE